jgi:hypothetical protein
MEALESRTLLSAAATHLVITRQPANLVAGNDLSTITVQVEDGHGQLVASSPNVTLAIGKGPNGATLGGVATAAATEGTATFSGLSLLKAGTYTLVATDGTDRAATTKKFTVTASTASMLAFVEEPANTTGRTGIGTIKVAVEDAYGNVATGDNSKVSLAVASGPDGASLGGTFIANAKHGVALFKGATLAASGTYTLSASDGDLTAATSNSFTISTSATQLVFTHVPTTAIGNTSMSVVVTLEDASGHVTTGDHSKVTLGLASGTGPKLLGTLTVAAVAGVATFTNVVEHDGSYTLVAKDGKLKSAASTTITVVAGPAVSLKILSTFVQGTSNNDLVEGAVGPITVAVIDSHGNIVTAANAKDSANHTINGSTMTLVLNTTLDTEATIGTVTQAQTATATVSGGVATFTSLTTEASGWYELVVSDGGLIGASQRIYVR